MLVALSDSFDIIAKDRSVKAAILRSGGTHFCAGHNLKELPAQIHGRVRRNWGEVADPCKRLAFALARHGISKCDTVALIAPISPRHWNARWLFPCRGTVRHRARSSFAAISSSKATSKRRRKRPGPSGMVGSGPQQKLTLHPGPEPHHVPRT